MLCQGGGVKADVERKMSEPSAASCSQAAKPPARVAHEVTHKSGSSSSKSGVLTVLDCTFVELMELGPSDVEEHDIHWLKQQVRGEQTDARR